MSNTTCPFFKTARIKSAGEDAALMEVATGGHYQPMIDSGIPAGIEWIKQHLK